MTRSVEKDARCTTYSYYVKDFSKEEMLLHIAQILKAEDITSHGLILTKPEENEDWSGDPKPVPYIPDEQKFASVVKDIPVTCVTAFMEYRGETLILTYMPEASILTIILPHEFGYDIEEIEKNVIPDEIDLNPGFNIGE